MKHFEEYRKELIFQPSAIENKSCHASNICLMKNGELICAWFAGSREGMDDVAIWTSRTEGGIWTPPVMTAYDCALPHWNPVLYQRADGALLLFYKVGRVIASWSTHFRISMDNGRTFSDPQELVKGDQGGRGPVRCKLITLSDGSMLAGASTEKGIWKAYSDHSTDGGLTWNLSDPVEIDLHGTASGVESDIPLSDQSFSGRGVIQPTLWEDSKHHLHMLLRSSEGCIYRSDADDLNARFSKPYPTSLPNNNSGIDVARMPDGLLCLAMNPVSVNFGPRTPIVLMVSEDNGSSWEAEAILENKKDLLTGNDAEYSYPSIIAHNEDLYITYTWQRKSIAFHHLRRTTV